MIVEFKVTKEMIPNAYVGVALIRKGAPASGQEPEDDHQFKVGYAPFNVSAEEKRLSVSVVPEKKNARPAEELKVDFEVRDQAGKPAPGEVVVMVVDEAILALTGYAPPDLVSVIYPHRGLSMRLSDNRRFLLHQQKFSEKGNDGGGGDGPSVAVRQLFQNLAYYNPSLMTGSDGKASIKFKLPDNLTQWRIMAVAVTKDDRFGDGKAPVTVSLPLVSRPVLPRFTRLGDSFKAGVTIQVSGDVAGEVTVSASLPEKNSVILFTGQDVNAKATVPVKPGETKKVLFPYIARTPGNAPLKFITHFEGKGQRRQGSNPRRCRADDARGPGPSSYGDHGGSGRNGQGEPGKTERPVRGHPSRLGRAFDLAGKHGPGPARRGRPVSRGLSLRVS